MPHLALASWLIVLAGTALFIWRSDEARRAAGQAARLETAIVATLILLTYLGLYVWGKLDARRARNQAAATELTPRSPDAAGTSDLILSGAGSLGSAGTTLLFIAFLTALVATLGALFIGEVLGHTPCTLCWYQRIAMFPLVPILAIGLWRADTGTMIYALPLVLAGLAVALWHSGLYAGLIPEKISPCTSTGPSCSDRTLMAILDLPLPYLSLSAFAVIALCLVLTKGKRT